MKCTLRKVHQGVVATIDERPYKNEFYYDLQFKAVIELLYYNNHSDYQKIIASTFGLGKELVIPTKTNLGAVIFENICDGSEYEYTETETQIIIQL